MTVLVGGLRVLGANAGKSSTASSPSGPETLSNDFFRQPARHGHRVAARRRRRGRPTRDATARTGAVKWTGTRVDLIFGSHSQLRAWPRSMPARREGEIRQGLRGNMGQDHAPRSLRSRLIAASACSRKCGKPIGEAAPTSGEWKHGARLLAFGRSVTSRMMVAIRSWRAPSKDKEAGLEARGPMTLDRKSALGCAASRRRCPSHGQDSAVRGEAVRQRQGRARGCSGPMCAWCGATSPTCRSSRSATARRSTA